ncbi:MAG TPA: hypothetical protein VFI41_00625 [Gemmatimonadales bacterium]|nr:hypothetical protein [Gemmatimonadales bacterium]
MTATAVPEAAGRQEDARVRPARLVEGTTLQVRPVGAPEVFREPLAFLDGVQRSEVVAYAGSSPLLVAEVAAAVRLRQDRQLATVAEERLLFVAGRAASLALAGGALAGAECHVIEDDGPAHPLRDLELARRLVDRIRGNLELSVYDRFRAAHDEWILVDGSLAGSPALAADRRAVGLSKSHATLPFEGQDLERYLRLPAGCRSSMFQPAGERAPVVAWGLRLWPFEGRDLLHGFVRLEVSPSAASSDHADEVSRWVLAERTPVSADARWDRLLYGIHSVEQYLKAGTR